MEGSNGVVEEELDGLEGFEGEEEITAYLELKERNHERFKDLAKQGVRIDPIQIIQVQFDVLLSTLGPDVTAAWAFLFEQRMEGLLIAIEADLPRQKLLAGTQQPLPADVSKLIQP